MSNTNSGKPQIRLLNEEVICSSISKWSGLINKPQSIHNSHYTKPGLGNLKEFE